MTSTSFNVGLGDGSRLSSRVLRPPGGGHTDIFSGEPEPPRGRRLVPAASGAMFGHGDDTSKSTKGAQSPTQNGASEASEPAPQPEAPQPAATPPAPVEPVVVAEPVAVPERIVANAAKESKPATPAVTPTEQIKAEPPKRVRVPPGGFSSGLW